MKLSRHERRRIAAIARKYRGLQASTLLDEVEHRARASEELAPARSERSRKLRALGLLGLLILVFSAFACAVPRPIAPARGAAFVACSRAGISDEFCSCYEKALPQGVQNPSRDQVLDAMESCAGAPEERHGFKSLKDLPSSVLPLEPPVLAAR